MVEPFERALKSINVRRATRTEFTPHPNDTVPIVGTPPLFLIKFKSVS